MLPSKYKQYTFQILYEERLYIIWLAKPVALLRDSLEYG